VKNLFKIIDKFDEAGMNDWVKFFATMVAFKRGQPSANGAAVQFTKVKAG